MLLVILLEYHYFKTVYLFSNVLLNLSYKQEMKERSFFIIYNCIIHFNSKFSIILNYMCANLTDLCIPGCKKSDDVAMVSSPVVDIKI